MERRHIRDTDYTIDRLGRVFNPRGRVISTWVEANTGYSLLRVRKNGKPLCLRLHRVLGECWVPNPDNLPFVKHKDDDKSNNLLENLVWGSNPDNVQEGYDNGQYQYHQRRHKISAIHKITREKIIFSSLRSASEVLDVDRKGVSAILKGKKVNNYEYEFHYEMPND